MQSSIIMYHHHHHHHHPHVSSSSSSCIIIIIIQVTTNHLHDEIVLEWGLRVLTHLSLEKGMLMLLLLLMQMIDALCIDIHLLSFID